MRKTVFLFPGQGSQAVGMGKELAQSYPQAKEVFAEADGDAKDVDGAVKFGSSISPLSALNHQICSARYDFINIFV